MGFVDKLQNCLHRSVLLAVSKARGVGWLQPADLQTDSQPLVCLTQLSSFNHVHLQAYGTGRMSTDHARYDKEPRRYLEIALTMITALLSSSVYPSTESF